MPFDQAAKTYLKHNKMQLMAADILDDLLPNKGELALDLGAGPGASLKKLAARYSRVIGCDLSIAMAKLATNMVVADANKLPFKKNSFDLVYSNLMLQWITDLSNVAQQIHKITKYNGEVIASTLGPSSLHEARQALASINRPNNINDFTDMHTVGDTFFNCGWQEVYIGNEIIEVEYASAAEVFYSLKNIGANTMLNPNASRTTISPRTWQKCLNNYPKRDGKYFATYEIVTIRAKKKLAKNEVAPNMITRS